MSGPEGKAFSDPAVKLDMPDEWLNKPLKYEKWAKNADLAITLDQHIYPALLPIINEYSSKKNVKIAVNKGTCGISAGLLVRKSVDMAGFCCPPAMSDRFPDLNYHTVGIGALGIYVNSTNPVSNITLDQAQRIFMGEITNWSELHTDDGKRGPDKPILTAARLHCKLRPGHWRLLLDNEDLFSARMKTVGSIKDIMLEVYKNNDAIAGMETLYMANHENGPDHKVKSLRIDGYDPAVSENLISGNYKFYFTFNITTWSEEGLHKPIVTDLKNYIIKHADRVESRFGIVPSEALRKAGWKFHNEELVGEPVRTQSSN